MDLINTARMVPLVKGCDERAHYMTRILSKSTGRIYVRAVLRDDEDYELEAGCLGIGGPRKQQYILTTRLH